MSSNVSSKNSYKKNILIIGTVIFWILINILILSILVLNWPKIFPNLFIENFYVGGLKPEDARVRIEEIFQGELDSFRIQLAYGDIALQLSCDDLGIYYDFDDYVLHAYEIGRVGNYYERIKSVYNLRKNPKIIRLKPYYDKVKVKNKINELSEIINKPAINANIERKNGEFIITKEIPGIEIDKEVINDRIINAIENLNSQPLEISVINIEPKIVEEELKKIKDLIGVYQTTFNMEDKGRTENIKIAANSINKTLLMPGEEFSFNDCTGPRSVKEGYKEAPVIINGELVPGIGGGICQVSTTLYQAALRADTEITSRKNHGLPVGYVPLGQDATVAYGYIDFKFKNNKDYPIYLESYIAGNQIFVKLYGKKTDNISIDLKSEVTEVIEPNVEIKQDPNMKVGETLIEKPSKKGYRVVTYKIYLQGGKELKKEITSKSYYPPRNGVIIEGSKLE